MKAFDLCKLPKGDLHKIAASQMNIAVEQEPAIAAELKIEIPGAALGLDEKFHTGIPADLGLIPFGYCPNILVPDRIHPVKVLAVVEHFALYFRMKTATGIQFEFRFHDIGFFPDGIVPFRRKGDLSGGSFNDILHYISP